MIFAKSFDFLSARSSLIACNSDKKDDVPEINFANFYNHRVYKISVILIFYSFKSLEFHISAYCVLKDREQLHSD